jgi:hypothetical protein
MIQKYFSGEIPPFFNKFDTDVPFTRCTFCDEPLEGKTYVVEKFMKRNKTFNTSEIIYEYCICFDCASNKQDDISEESMEKIMQLYQNHSNSLLMKLEYLHTTEKYNLDSWMENCSMTGMPINQCEEFAVSAIIEDGQLVFERFPMVVSDVFLELIQENLSKETKESFNGLKDKIINSTPGVEDIIGTPTVGMF